MQVAKIIKQARKMIRTARRRDKKIGFVPTMGALHRGHISLIDACLRKCDYSVVSIFVNPTQFGPGEDFKKYPRTINKDLEICKKKGVDLVFLPTAEEMYPEEKLTWVKVEKLTETLCGEFRPGHFDGVTTVCTKLFNIITPDWAFFGQKDAQQAVVIKKMVKDLNIPVEIITSPTLREEDGLAVSSRNKYLSTEQRKQATVIYEALCNARRLIKEGARNPEKIKSEIEAAIKRASHAKIQYVRIVDAESLRKLEKFPAKTLIAVAVYFGEARLIDNILVDTTK